MCADLKELPASVQKGQFHEEGSDFQDDSNSKGSDTKRLRFRRLRLKEGSDSGGSDSLKEVCLHLYGPTPSCPCVCFCSRGEGVLHTISRPVETPLGLSVSVLATYKTRHSTRGRARGMTCTILVSQC